MDSFRVQVNLSQYFSDYRQKSWVYVDPNNFKTLSDLKRHISEVFAIDGDFEIFVCDCFVPSKEDVGIINEKDVLELRKRTDHEDGNQTVRDSVSSQTLDGKEERRKRRKRKENNDENSQLDTDQSFDFVNRLPESFHPDCNSTMTRKKRKKAKCSSPVKEIDVTYSDNLGKTKIKKFKVINEKYWNSNEVVHSSAVQISGEGMDNITTMCVELEDEKCDKVKSSSPAKDSLEKNANDLQEANNSGAEKKVTNDVTCHVLSAPNSLLEHTIFEEGEDFAERENEVADLSFSKRKRKRRGRRKRKIIARDNPVTDLTTRTSNAAEFSSNQSFVSALSNSRKHMRFSYNDDDEENSAVPAQENYAGGESEHFSDEDNVAEVGEFPKPSSSLSNDHLVSIGGEKAEDCNIESHDQEGGRILKFESINSVRNVKTASEPKSISSPVGRWRKKAVLNTGLGATLAHLMKDVETEFRTSSTKPSSVKDVPRIKPPPSVPDKSSFSSKNYSDFPIVEKFPRERDILAFKILKMSDHYEPCISNYIECVVISCDEDQSMVTVKILEGVKEFDKVNGKFEIHLEEEKEETQNKDLVLTFNWKDMIQPRLMFP